ncbi:glycoside hydrolase family 65 protein [Lacihabitans sp. CCS-44]|uniref:family 65 glycosyl hydrolase domain-containing protein n=1 Tax=Lacihabitans sp. CCS-44 TaxID=2487331 RepID=UPI0020CBE10D|nr:family 65 glycosyl hydrolase domain-containing protein [Lacihabitans sp. CCS-44]MCP9756920.1 glycoside hydrolase family 65 protein [Lacihabitans sp. CCS-44]
MKSYIKHDEWRVVESGFHAEFNEITESLMSLGNGKMGQRGNFEERYSGKTLQGNYVAGVWFPDKTRVGWWKNGYPDYFAKVINSINWIGIDIEIDGEMVDLAKCEILEFYRELHMQHGHLMRFCKIRLQNGKELHIESVRFCSITHDQIGQVDYEIIPVNFDGKIKITPYLDGNVQNRDSNYNEYFWDEISKSANDNRAYLQVKTKENKFAVERFDICAGMDVEIFLGGHKQAVSFKNIESEKYTGLEFEIDAKKMQSVRILKKVAIHSSNNFFPDYLVTECEKSLDSVANLKLQVLQRDAWKLKWENCDIKIEGDESAQQGIRFNIFHLLQTYTGQDARLNIGPKGFTGEKYGGVTYWDTEAYCIPFYLSAAEHSVARNLLVYRYNHLQKAILNAQKLGFKKGAALYPMVTMNGEECHNEWEITFEEIHRNGAIAYAIYDYINYTGDETYLNEFGLEVLISISRFWSQRITWSENLRKFVMLGVTGPNEYENNVNNNWYTNYIAIWTLKYTLEAINKVKNNATDYLRIKAELNFEEKEETARWTEIVDKMHFPYDEERQVYLQQDGFLDKELLNVEQIRQHRPINQNWSWDRILRSCFIKQADVLQGLCFFEDDFDIDTQRRNFDFYEPMTVHESSLSPCVHTILACKLDKIEKAYEMYVRTARLDLDDYNNDTEDGLHITSMAGTWMSVVKGFGGMRVKNTQLHLNPILPSNWESLSFRVGLKNNLLEIGISKDGVTIKNLSESDVEISLFDNKVLIKGNSEYFSVG